MLDPALVRAYLGQVDGSGAVRPRTSWAAGRDLPIPPPAGRLSAEWADPVWAAGPPGAGAIRPELAAVLERSRAGRRPTTTEIGLLLTGRGAEVEAVAEAADELRRRAKGEAVTYVLNRNINYTNRCRYRCGFCAFSRGGREASGREAPFLMSLEEVAAQAAAAVAAGATEICLQGGIHPAFTGDSYLALLGAVREAAPGLHLHAFSPLEVWHGAETLGMGVGEFLGRLREVGLGSLPGTAAEILDDGVRRVLCPDKIPTARWVEVVAAAHRLGIPTTATIMFGHVDGPASWARHLEVVRRLQGQTGGFTEFVPLPFVHMEAPLYRQGRARPGPTWDEVVLLHGVSRLALDGLVDNIQASWVKLGLDGAAALLAAGVNDLGGTLMEESISRAAGAAHGAAVTAPDLERAIRAVGRVPRRRTTLYEAAAEEPARSGGG
ncbi:MAG: 5-amino-6-(D-ribitylamino)uracil--L-tyrosine 4-hydroxyphenyl transferase CofH [Acidimicrobiia bacterium]|nr:5-amino-6-(D-ribitylamino)uracil--L-tyrosine 4-hydroxyphenyl transferase CofH [Acidimicrobiia bacterium]